MEALFVALVSGVVLGLASSLHCAGMCCGIASSILFMFDPPQQRLRHRAVVLSHLGRATSYITIGALLGGLGGVALLALPSPVAYRLLQWAAAVALMWIGLSTAGLLPSFALADRVLAPVSASIAGWATRYRSSRLGPFGVGMAWGCTPCAMVYGAYLTAMVSGTAERGALIMAGFALATVPALALSSLGARSLARRASGVPKVAIGLAIAASGFAAAFLAPAARDAI